MLTWLKENRFNIDVVESKAVYNFSAGRYDHGQTDAGFSDLVGVTPYFGVACYIELKAPGKRSTLKPHQRDFLLAKINAGAFAVCADSIVSLSECYEAWRMLRKCSEFEASKVFLKTSLPKVKELTDNLSDITG